MSPPWSTNGPRQVGQKFAHESAHRQRPQPLAERGRAVDVDKEQHFPFLHRAMIGADDEVEQRAQPDEMGDPHHQDAGDRKGCEEGESVRQAAVHHRQIIQPP
jgi:hypothetical protein